MDKIIFVIFISIGILIYLVFRKSERFYPLADRESQGMLNSLNKAVAHILDNTKTRFTGFLSPLNLENYYQKISIREGYSSFTENKKNIVLCMKDTSGNVYPFNSMLYVLLHEIAHVINDELHHTKKFKKIFDELLQHATRLGYYNPNLPFESNYCS